MRGRAPLLLALGLGLAGCGSTTHEATIRPSTSASSTVRPARPTTTTAQLHSQQVEPATAPHSARPCWSAANTPYVTIDLNPDTAEPPCVSVAGWQRIAMVNRTDAFGFAGHILRFQFLPFPKTALNPEETVRYDEPVDRYLAPGDHTVPSAPGFTGVEVYVRASATPSTPSPSATQSRPHGALVVSADTSQGYGQDTSMYVGCTEWTVELDNNSDTAIRSVTFAAREADYYVDSSSSTQPAPLPPATTQYVNLAPGARQSLRFQWCQHPYPTSEPGSYEVRIGTVTYQWITDEEARTCLGCS